MIEEGGVGYCYVVEWIVVGDELFVIDELMYVVLGNCVVIGIVVE